MSNGEPSGAKLFQFLAEAPEAFETGRVQQLADEILDWILEPGGRPRGRLAVAGLFAGRGWGKTSVLMTVGSRALQRAGTGQSIAVAHRNSTPVLLEVARMEGSGELPFELLRHLEEHFPGRDQDALNQAYAALTRRAKPERFFELANEETVSLSKLPEKLVQVHKELAFTTETVRIALRRVVQSIRDATADHHGPLLLLVDDVDIKPERTLPLLELLHTYLDLQEDVVVLLAADPEVMLQAVSAALERQGQVAALQAWAFVDKLVPYRFGAHRWPGPECFAFLWAPVGYRSVLQEFWPAEGLLLAQEANRQARDEQKGNAEERRRKQGDPDQQPAEPVDVEQNERFTDSRAWALSELSPFLTGTPRRLKALHNRLLGLLGPWRSKLQLLAWQQLAEAFGRDLQLPRPLVAPMLSLLLACDIRHPELGLWNSPGLPLARLPEVFRELLSDLHKPSGSEDGSGEHALVISSDLPLLDRLREPYLIGRRKYYANEAVRNLARTWGKWAKVTSLEPPRTTHLLALSLNADARESSRAAWEGQLPAERIWHIDLRPVLEQAGKLALRIDPAGLQLARQQLATELERQGVPDHQGELWLAGRAQNSLMAWLGWRLNRLRRVRAFNIFGGRITPFEGPAEPLRYREDGLFWKLMPQAVAPAEGEPTGEGEAVVLVDLLGQSTAAQLDWFAGLQTCRQRVRLLGQPPLPPEDLEAGLRDCLELLGQLKHDQGIHTFHLALAAPDVFAFFLGQQLHEFASFRLYELYREPGQAGAYRHVLDLA